MAKKGELFADEEMRPTDAYPGTINDDEELERRLPSEGAWRDGGVPKAAFTRQHLRWKEGEGGASVHRSNYIRGAVGGRRGSRGTIKARAGDIREQVDDAGERKWHVVPSPQQDDPSHAEIYRDPKGARPTARDREEFLSVWKDTVQALLRCKAQAPDGRAEVVSSGTGGIRLRWNAGNGQATTLIGQVETIREAVRTLVKAEIIHEADTENEEKRLQADLMRQLEGGSEMGSPNRGCGM